MKKIESPIPPHSGVPRSPAASTAGWFGCATVQDSSALDANSGPLSMRAQDSRGAADRFTRRQHFDHAGGPAALAKSVYRDQAQKPL